jgi:hypothetical protein
MRLAGTDRSDKPTRWMPVPILVMVLAGCAGKANQRLSSSPTGYCLSALAMPGTTAFSDCLVRQNRRMNDGTTKSS